MKGKWEAQEINLYYCCYCGSVKQISYRLKEDEFTVTNKCEVCAEVSEFAPLAISPVGTHLHFLTRKPIL